jgi:hypothetical protein
MPHFGANTEFLASYVVRAKTHCSYVDRNPGVSIFTDGSHLLHGDPADSGALTSAQFYVGSSERYLNFRLSGRAPTVNVSKTKLA